MAKKKLTIQKQPSIADEQAKAHPLLLKIRDVSQRIVCLVDMGDMKMAAAVMKEVVPAMEQLTKDFGSELEDLPIPDGFLDALDQRARRLALFGIVYAVTAAWEE